MDVNEELKFLRKFKKKKIFVGGRSGRVGGPVGGGGQGRCELRSEVFLKLNKKLWGGRVFFFVFFVCFFFLGGGGVQVGGSGWMKMKN